MAKQKKSPINKLVAKKQNLEAIRDYLNKELTSISAQISALNTQIKEVENETNEERFLKFWESIGRDKVTEAEARKAFENIGNMFKSEE